MFRNLMPTDAVEQLVDSTVDDHESDHVDVRLESRFEELRQSPSGTPTAMSETSTSAAAPPLSASPDHEAGSQSRSVLNPPSAHNNNTICQSYGQAELRDEPMGYGAESSNTSDFLSSTFSLLTADSLAAEPVHGNWTPYAEDQPPEKRMFYEHDQSAGYYAPEQGFGVSSSYSHEHHDQELGNHGQPIFQPPSGSGSESAEPSEKRAKKNSGSSTARNFQLEYTESFKRFINIPAGTPQRSASSADSGVQSPAESDESDAHSQPISCPACKSVYSSPRSLTGHIGRTEKCRELIGRDYLDEIAKMGKSACIPDPAIMGEGISPVCPHCNRFISHYKGNIRRHINSCRKISGRKDSTASAAEAAGSNESNGSMASYEVTGTPDEQPCSSIKKEFQVEYQHVVHHPGHPVVHFSHYPEDPHGMQMQHPHSHLLQPHHLSQSGHHVPPMGLVRHPHHLSGPPQHMQMHGYPPMDYAPIYESMHHVPPMQNNVPHYEITYVTAPVENVPQQPPTVVPQPENAQKLPRPPKHNGMVSHDDPYLCAWCTFSTVYKGNMKRHLISCHNCNDELLRKYNFELEKLRKSAPQRAGPDSLPFIEIKPPQPPGTRRARNPPTAKSLGRPKKSNSTSGEKTTFDSQCSAQQPMSAPPIPPQHPPPDYLLEPNMQPYNLLHAPSHPQLMVEYGGAPMHFVPGQMAHPPNATYIIKDCGNDSGLGMSVEEYAEVANLHQAQALPGY